MSAAKSVARKRPDRAIRREQIFEHAIRIIGQRGYYGFSVQELAESCGLTNGGLLYYFSSKDALLIALLEDRDRRDTEVVSAVIKSAAAEDDPARTFQAIVARNVTQPDLVRLFAVLQAEALDRSHPAHDFFAKREAAILDIYAELLSSHVAEPRRTAMALMSLMYGLEQMWLRADQGFDLVAAWDRAAQLLLADVGDQDQRTRTR